MAITPSLYLDPEQRTRFNGFFSDRAGDREYAYKPLDGAIPVVHFLRVFKIYLQQHLGPDAVEKITLKGGASRYIITGNLTRLPDIDLEIHLQAIENLAPLAKKDAWNRVSSAFYQSLAEVTQLPQIRNADPGWTNARKLVQDKEKQVAFSVHGVPAYRQGREQSIDMCVAYTKQKTPLASSSLTSADALHIDLTGYVDQVGLEHIPVCTVDGYDPRLSMELLKKRQCTVLPPTRIRLLFRGSFAYCHNLTKGCYPNSPAIDEEFLHDLHTQFTQPELRRYLDLHYADNPHGRVIYLLNCYGLAKRYRKISKEHKDQMIQEIFKCLQRELGGSSAPYTVSEMWQFFRHASGYLHLRSKNSIPAENWPQGYFLSDVTCHEVGCPHLFAATPPDLFRELKRPPESVLAHPLLAALMRLFPHSHENLQTFFKNEIESRFPEEGQTEPQMPAEPKTESEPEPEKKPTRSTHTPKPQPTLLELLERWKTMRPKQVFQETGQNSEWAKAYVQTKPEKLSAEEAFAFWSTFGFDLFTQSDQTLDLESLFFVLKKLPKKELPRVYDLLNPKLLSDSDQTFRSLFPWFFRELYPSQAKLLKMGLERWMRLEGGPFVEVLEHLARYCEILKSNPELKEWFLSQSSQISDSVLIQNATRQLNAKPKIAKQPSEPAAKIPPLFLEFEELVKKTNPDFEELHRIFGQIIQTEAPQAFWPRLNRLIEQKEFPQPIRVLLSLFGLHLLTNVNPPDCQQIERILNQGLDQAVLNYQQLNRKNPFVKHFILKDSCTQPPTDLSYFDCLILNLLEKIEEPVAQRLIEKILKKNISVEQKLDFAHTAITMIGYFDQPRILKQGFALLESALTPLLEQGSFAGLALFQTNLQELLLKARISLDRSFLEEKETQAIKIQERITLRKNEKVEQAHRMIEQIATELSTILLIEEDKKFIPKIESLIHQLDQLPVLLNLSPLHSILVRTFSKPISNVKRKNILLFTLKILALSPGETLMKEFKLSFDKALKNRLLPAKDILDPAHFSFSLKPTDKKSLWAIFLHKISRSEDKSLVHAALAAFREQYSAAEYAESLMTMIREAQEMEDISTMIDSLSALEHLLRRLKISNAEQNRFLNLIFQVAQISLRFPKDETLQEDLFGCYTRFVQDYPERIRPKLLSKKQFFSPNAWDRFLYTGQK